MQNLPKALQAIVIQMEAEGYEKGTPSYEYVFMKRKVEACQEMRSQADCRMCPYFDHCELAKSYLRQTLEFKQQAAAEAVKRKKEALKRAAASVGHVFPMVAVEEKEDD